jgi:hypothetical protein
MRAGLSEGIITPNFPVLMAGYPEPKDRYHREVHDDLFVHCFYLSDAGTELALISFDLGELSKKRTRAIREAVEKRCGIPGKGVSVSCTHTHSGPVTTTLSLWNDDRELYPFYLDFITETAAENMARAKAGAFEASLCLARGRCGKEQGVGGNRRDRDGPADPEVGVLGIREKEGALRGLLVNYALHPTFLHAESRALSADYPGYIYRYFKEKQPALVTGFLQGASGNQSSRHFRQGQSFDEAKRAAYAIAAGAERALASAPVLENPRLFAASYDFDPPLYDIPAPEKALEGEKQARREYEEAKAAGKPYPLVRTLECSLIGAEHLLEIARAGETALRNIRGNSPFEVQIMGIGDYRLVFYSCEIFVEFALRLKRESPFPLFFTSCTNGGASGYICTPEAHAEGGYEALWTRYRPETGDMLVDFTLDKLRKP